MNDFDTSLSNWLIRIGVTPFQPATDTSPLINLALQHFSWKTAHDFINAELEDLSELDVLFARCGYPNLVQAEVNASRLLDSLSLHGRRLQAHSTQYNMLSKTSLAPVIDYVDDGNCPLPEQKVLYREDCSEFSHILKKTRCDRDIRFSLRRDDGFMLALGLTQFLLTPNEMTLGEVAVSLRQYMPFTLSKSSKFVDGNASMGSLLTPDMLYQAAESPNVEWLIRTVKNIIPMPFGLSQARHAMVLQYFNEKLAQGEVVHASQRV